MKSSPVARSVAAAVALLGGIGLGACAPQRIPGSTIDQGDPGIAFVSGHANARGTAPCATMAGAPSRPAAPCGSGSSSSSVRGSVPDSRTFHEAMTDESGELNGWAPER